MKIVLPVFNRIYDEYKKKSTRLASKLTAAKAFCKTPPIYAFFI